MEESVILDTSTDIMGFADIAVGLDFTTLVSNLDNTASEIVAFQRDSTVQRKDLAQKTKDFRKLDDASKLTEMKGLLKGRRAFGASCLTDHD
jgi:homeobox protein cut-like